MRTILKLGIKRFAELNFRSDGCVDLNVQDFKIMPSPCWLKFICCVKDLEIHNKKSCEFYFLIFYYDYMSGNIKPIHTK